MEADYLNQALLTPIEDLALIETHIRLVSGEYVWTDVAIFIDEGEQAILILLLQENQIVSMLRMCLAVEESVSAIIRLVNESGSILFGCYQGENFSEEDIQSISRINDIWNGIDEQIVEFSLEDVREFFKRIEEGSKIKGRGKDFSAETKRRVMLDSHGRCMFAGCGEVLGFDGLTGTEGNFAYLAHNVASSELGARGAVMLSEKLSNDPNNVLLLCDKHHRLIDKIAAVDYPAHRLSEMRRYFCTTANRLLKGLGYHPIPVYSVLWPVHRQSISAPSYLQVAQSLVPIGCRMESQIHDISDNESLLREADTEFTSKALIHSIQLASEKILAQSHTHRYTAGLFAFGLMPPLIALGALLGNKSRITPMLKYRDSGQWIWPLGAPVGEFYTVSGLDELAGEEAEISLTLALTAEPDKLIRAREEIAKARGVKHVVVKALPEYLGNGALGHPEDGYAFTCFMQKLLHRLRDQHGVEYVHLLPCASNAACVFFGQAYDSHHPEVIVYDFADCSMEPFLLITNLDNRCKVSAVE
ncbi:MAG: SAVED domain-containing protein [Candidatus Thiodiazotropha sp. (ex Lucinoma borealis)]|nr:SAVED domain-containing protein [Candidatus Thiodiazotropha sp. (ex Lucinoma borealis)]MCU7866132.1 SAVED domain-containing protein [Candidatus Thiodiazotropha sp. (ex Lucinoma borealis)]